MTKCLSCGYVTPEIELNCPECGSFYTLVVDANAEEQKSETATTKNKSENATVDEINKKK